MMNNLAMSIGQRVKALRASKGLSQGALAKLIKVSQAALSKVESGAAHKIRGSTLNALAKVLEVNPQWLETGLGSPAPQKTVTVDHTELIDLYNHLTESNRDAWMTIGRTLLSTQNNVPKKVQPFPIKQ